MEVPDQVVGFDKAVALGRVGGDEELLREIAQIFLDECPEALAEIRSASESGDAKGLERAAHSLKGSIGNFGAKAAHDAAYRLEQMGRTGEMQGTAEALGDLETALQGLTSELDDLTTR